MAAIERADHAGRVGEGLLQDRHDAVRHVLPVGADGDEPHASGARRAQHVQPRAIAVVDAGAEAGGGLNLLHVGIDDRQPDPAREQHLRRHLADAAEADEEHAAACVRVVLLRLRHRRLPRQQRRQARDEGCEDHGGRDQRKRLAWSGCITWADAATEKSTKPNSPS